METMDSASDVRLQALKSLHMILQEKDQNVQVYKDKAVRYERALQQAECRIARLMQLHAGAAAATSETSSDSNLSPGKASSRENTLTAGDMHAQQKKRSRLVPDCSTAPSAVHTDLKDDDLVSRGPTGRPQNSRTKLDNNDLETDGDGPIRPAGTRTGTAVLPGVSRVLFDNAVKENIRLKKMLQETLQKDGSNLKVFLERQEYADVIKQLRAELVAKHQKVEEMQSWIAMQKAGQSQQLLVQMLELQNRVQHLTKEGQVRTAMVENCLKENDKLRTENTALKSNQGGYSTQSSVNHLKQTNDGLKKQLEEERKKHHLQIQKLMETTQSNTSNTTPDNDLDSLRSKVSQLEVQLQNEADSKELQKEQLHSYEEDYRKLQKELNQKQEKNDKEINILHGQIKNLQKDKQRIEKDFTRERQKTQTLEGLIVKYAPTVLQQTGGVPAVATTCAQQMKEPWMTPGTSHQPPSILVPDGPQSIEPKKGPNDSKPSGTSKKLSGARAKSSSFTKGSTSPMEGTFKCEMCYKTDFKSEEHYRDHVRKCVPQSSMT